MITPFGLVPVSAIFTDTLDGSRWCKTLPRQATCIETFAGWILGNTQEFDFNDSVIELRD